MELLQLEFQLQAENSFALPDFKGSTFRGKFGHVLKRTVCIFKGRECGVCEIKAHCAYFKIFQPENEKAQQVPRPFVLIPPLTKQRRFLRDEKLYVGLVLIGDAIQYLPYFVYALIRMGEEGIGVDRGRYRVTHVRAVNDRQERVEIYDPEKQEILNIFEPIHSEQFAQKLLPEITLQFYTPAWIKHQGRVTCDLQFPLLLKAILRRYRSLLAFHGDGITEKFPIDWELAETVEVVQSDLHFKKFKRYSNRQGRPVPLQGFEGRITYRGEIGPFYPWLKIGEYIHIGKGAVFGMGGYKILNLK